MCSMRHMGEKEMNDLQKAAQQVLEPQVGEAWHILRVGATACQTRTVAAITPLTVVFKFEVERWPRRNVEFLERVSFAANLPPLQRKPLTDDEIITRAIEEALGIE